LVPLVPPRVRLRARGGSRPVGVQGIHARPNARRIPVTTSTLAAWHQLVAHSNAEGLAALLADDVVFHSPVVHAPQVGKALALRYLAAAVHVLGNESFRYVRELVADRDAMLEFQVEVNGVLINGVDIIRWNDEGKIVDFKVMLRPLKAINLVHQQMAALLQAKQ
jgi:hypothetical protein